MELRASRPCQLLGQRVPSSFSCKGPLGRSPCSPDCSMPPASTSSHHNILFPFPNRLHCGQHGWPVDTEFSDQSLMALDLLLWDNEVGDGAAHGLAALGESHTLMSLGLDVYHNCITRNGAVASRPPSRRAPWQKARPQCARDAANVKRAPSSSSMVSMLYRPAVAADGGSLSKTMPSQSTQATCGPPPPVSPWSGDGGEDAPLPTERLPQCNASSVPLGCSALALTGLLTSR